MRESYGKLHLSEKQKGKVWKDYMERIFIEENDLDHNGEGDLVEGRVDCVSRNEVVQKTNELKIKYIIGLPAEK